ncbi:MAG TPA: DUF4139 domain-containing protein [Alphaproteobacteria bacterium]|nr:DUF4139 domain-containing protein [Alphaproteobacteria bacterium]
MRKFLALAFCCAAFLGCHAGARAADKTIGLAAQKSLGLTVYNGGTAMVRDVRAIGLDKGKNRLSFEGISEQIQPQTVSLRPTGEAGFALLEQDFSRDLLTPHKLAEAAVGQTVQVVRVNPATGAETTENATVVSANGGVVLKYDDRIEVLGGEGFNGRLIYKTIPQNLRARPTLSVILDAPHAASTNAELAYLTGGLSWSADYVANLNADETRADLQAWITLTNSSGTTFSDATLQLVAGDVHRVTRAVRARAESFSPAAAKVGSPDRESLGEYQLYTIPRAVTILDQQTKQLSLFEARDVKVTSRLQASDYGLAPRGADSDGDRLPVRKYLAIDNTRTAGLGMSMPEGAVRVYQRDGRGRSQFVGEDAIDHTPPGERADLVLGNSFDVTVRRKATNARTFLSHSDKLGDVTVHEASYEVTAKNASGKPKTLRYTHDFSPNWEITAENHPHDKPVANRAAWSLKLPAKSRVRLTYTVQVAVPRPQK